LSGAHEACFHVETRELWMCFVLSSKEVAAAGCFVGLNSSNASVQVDLRHLVEPHSRAGRLDFAACHDIDNPTSPPKVQRTSDDFACRDVLSHEACDATLAAGLCNVGEQHLKVQRGCRATCGACLPTAVDDDAVSPDARDTNQLDAVMPAPVHLPKWSPPGESAGFATEGLTPLDLLGATMPPVLPSPLADARRLQYTLLTSFSSMPIHAAHPPSHILAGHPSYAPVSWSIDGADTNGDRARRLKVVQTVGEQSVDAEVERQSNR